MDSPNNLNNHEEEDGVVEELPGFRFHPTDEELVGFYLRRKVDMKPLSIDLIKPFDIYKYDPWDLPKTSCTSGDKEWYFFCKRGRKYKNSIRPNRVISGSGFWKATGIDKPVHSQYYYNSKIKNNNTNNKNTNVIGLKKTLVYYRGSAGKGTKTDWMMHEFRLPSSNSDNDIRNASDKTLIFQEAEMWTLCRIFKRNVSQRKYTSDWRELSTKRNQFPNTDIVSSYNKKSDNYIDFSAPKFRCYEEEKPAINQTMSNNNNENDNHQVKWKATDIVHNGITSNMTYSIIMADNENDQILCGDTHWDELRAVVEYALNPSHA